MADDNEIAAILAEANKTESSGASEATAGGSSPSKSTKGGGGNPWIPVAVIAVVCPLLSFALIQFLILPKMEKSLEDVAVKMEAIQASQAESGNEAPVQPKAKTAQKEAKKESKEGGHGEGGEGGSKGYEFKGIVANISGALQSRYIRVSFTVDGDNPDLSGLITANHAKLVDATLSILSSLTLNDLEQPGIKNVLRSDLLGAYEAILHERVIKELYFSEFVVQ